jgi:hypothetical protein
LTPAYTPVSSGVRNRTRTSVAWCSTADLDSYSLRPFGTLAPLGRWPLAATPMPSHYQERAQSAARASRSDRARCRGAKHELALRPGRPLRCSTWRSATRATSGAASASTRRRNCWRASSARPAPWPGSSDVAGQDTSGPGRTRGGPRSAPLTGAQDVAAMLDARIRTRTGPLVPRPWRSWSLRAPARQLLGGRPERQRSHPAWNRCHRHRTIPLRSVEARISERYGSDTGAIDYLDQLRQMRDRAMSP